jgi:hypothetical protein
MNENTTMEPNDLPIVCLPMDLSDESAASLIEFLYQLTEALGQLLRHAHRYEPESLPPDAQATDPPF